jgi:TnpA family transposase
MPRRRALTEAQLESLLALPVTEADLLRHWTLSDDDLVAIGRRRRNHNQLGFALQLCALRYPGRLLRPDEVIPEPALRFVADQLGTAPEALTTYAARFQTRYEQLGVLRKSFGFTDLTTRRRQILEWLLPMALATTNAQTVATALLDELRRRRIIVPGPSTIERLVAATLVLAERHVARQLTGSLTPAQSEALDALLAPKQGTR